MGIGVSARRDTRVRGGWSTPGILVAVILCGSVAPSAGGGRALSASDRRIAEAGREGRALLREVQRDQAGAHAAIPRQDDPIGREAVRLRIAAERPGKVSRRRPAPARVGLSKGICRGCSP